MNTEDPVALVTFDQSILSINYTFNCVVHVGSDYYCSSGAIDQLTQQMLVQMAYVTRD